MNTKPALSSKKQPRELSMNQTHTYLNIHNKPNDNDITRKRTLMSRMKAASRGLEPNYIYRVVTANHH